MILSSLSLTIYIGNINDHYPEFTTENLTDLTFEILNDTYSSYTIESSLKRTELILIKPIVIDRDDNLIIRL